MQLVPHPVWMIYEWKKSDICLHRLSSQFAKEKEQFIDILGINKLILVIYKHSRQACS